MFGTRDQGFRITRTFQQKISLVTWLARKVHLCRQIPTASVVDLYVYVARAPGIDAWAGRPEPKAAGGIDPDGAIPLKSGGRRLPYMGVNSIPVAMPDFYVSARDGPTLGVKEPSHHLNHLARRPLSVKHG